MVKQDQIVCIKVQGNFECLKQTKYVKLLYKEHVILLIKMQYSLPTENVSHEHNLFSFYIIDGPI